MTLNLPKHVRTVGVDLAIELEQLSFAVVNQLPETLSLPRRQPIEAARAATPTPESACRVA